jgi:bacterioferritin-associated ferredoxin
VARELSERLIPHIAYLYITFSLYHDQLGVILVQSKVRVLRCCCMAVNRCICRGVMFSELLERARALGLADQIAIDDLEVLARLQDDTRLGTGCGACVPYARVALRTGRTNLPVMSPAEFERVLGGRDAGTVRART